MLLPLRFRTVKTFAASTLTLRFRTENSRFAAGSRANTMLVTKGLSQDVMLLAFVPLLLIPKESPSRNVGQPIYGIWFNKCHLQLLVDEPKIADRTIIIDGNRHMTLDLNWYSIV